jgi:glucosamine--fructose-6-phosphate aminotransferase (isomerizing)
MCGIFGVLSNNSIKFSDLRRLGQHSLRRGKDSSGLFLFSDGKFELYRSDEPITSLVKKIRTKKINFAIGHSRLITNGLGDNQPVYRDGVCVIHNGIVVNHDGLWERVGRSRKQEIDTEVIAAIAANHLEKGGTVLGLPHEILGLCKGIVACAIVIPKLGKLCLFSNNGSLYYCKNGDNHYFASEKFSLIDFKVGSVVQVRRDPIVLDVPVVDDQPIVNGNSQRSINLIPKMGSCFLEEKMLEYKPFGGRRCTRCILPESMPFIEFDEVGICNYCSKYKRRNSPRSIEALRKAVDRYRRSNGDDCIVPFSGGRDSCYTLHVVVNELKMRPITYTYDWGMVTDLGRRNISRMCAELGVENIIVAADIIKKRRNIKKNLIAWLKSPHLGMVSILTAGDKHFFNYIESVKKNTGISLNIWGVNPLEVTHFKSGFLGVRPDFNENKVYTSNFVKQLDYQWHRLRAMIQSPDYFNSSLWDTLSGEYYRSVHRKSDYFHLFDYLKWDEKLVDDILINKYGWEISPDTKTTWRIGDGTAAFYNYIYQTVVGFTEHDTFRSNQIREGEITREMALHLVEDENRPRYQNIKWYLDAVGMEYQEVIKAVNKIPRLANGLDI